MSADLARSRIANGLKEVELYEGIAMQSIKPGSTDLTPDHTTVTLQSHIDRTPPQTAFWLRESAMAMYGGAAGGGIRRRLWPRCNTGLADYAARLLLKSYRRIPPGSTEYHALIGPSAVRTQYGTAPSTRGASPRRSLSSAIIDTGADSIATITRSISSSAFDELTHCRVAVHLLFFAASTASRGAPQKRGVGR